MPEQDYRLNSMSPRFEIGRRKLALRSTISTEHPRRKNMYRAVRGEYKLHFSKVYNGRCAYCGVPLDVVSMDGCEIDHIVSVACAQQGLALPPHDVNELDNLAFSCRGCNRRKGDFPLDASCHDLLSPDHSLGSVFVRDERYGVDIASEHAHDPAARAFFERMELGSDLHRVDHLLAAVRDLRQYVEGAQSLGAKTEDVIYLLDAVFGILIAKRNMFSQLLSD